MYSHEQRRDLALGPADGETLRTNTTAWTFFQAQAPSYQRAAIHWVLSAKQEETRQRRLATLIDDSAHSRHVAPLRRRVASQDNNG